VPLSGSQSNSQSRQSGDDGGEASSRKQHCSGIAAVGLVPTRCWEHGCTVAVRLWRLSLSNGQITAVPVQAVGYRSRSCNHYSPNWIGLHATSQHQRHQHHQRYRLPHHQPVQKQTGQLVEYTKLSYILLQQLSRKSNNHPSRTATCRQQRNHKICSLEEWRP
jgi:hypothetical protein